MRTIIPRILEPIIKEYTTPVEMFEDISARALSCSEDIATFIQLHVDSTPIFEAANKIRQAGGVRRLAPCDMFLPPPNGDGKENEVPVVAKPQPEGEDTEMKDADAEEAEEVVALTKDEDVDEVIEEFSERLIHRDVQIDETPSADGKRVLKIHLPPPSSLLFILVITSSSEATADADSGALGSCTFAVTAVKSSKRPDAPPMDLHTGILRAVTARPHPGNLEILLEMLAAYKTIFSSRCEKCKKMVTGIRSELPVVRQLMRKEKRWATMHEICL